MCITTRSRSRAAVATTDPTKPPASHPNNRAGRSRPCGSIRFSMRSAVMGEPLFLGPAGLAVGLALKELRYGVGPRFAPGSVDPLVPPLPPVGGGTRQVFLCAAHYPLRETH